MGQLGDLLRESREAKGLSLEEVEAQTKIRRRLLQALEEEKFDALPAPVFAKGFLRNYARLLDLDGDRVIELYRQIVGDSDQPYELHVLSEPLEETSSLWPVVIAIIMLIALLSVAGWLAFRQGLIALPQWLTRGQPTLAATATRAASGAAIIIVPAATATLTSLPSNTSTTQPTGTIPHTAVPATASASSTVQPSETATIEPSHTNTTAPTQAATSQPLSVTPTTVAVAINTATLDMATVTSTTQPANTATSAATATATRTATNTPTAATTGSIAATMTATAISTLAPGAAAVVVGLNYQADAWMRIHVDGTKVYEGLVAVGTKQNWAATQQVYVHCGYGSGVLATVNGRSYGPLGPKPDTVRVEWSIAPGTPSVASASSPTQVVLATISP